MYLITEVIGSIVFQLAVFLFSFVCIKSKGASYKQRIKNLVKYLDNVRNATKVQISIY